MNWLFKIIEYAIGTLYIMAHIKFMVETLTNSTNKLPNDEWLELLKQQYYTRLNIREILDIQSIVDTNSTSQLFEYSWFKYTIDFILREIQKYYWLTYSYQQFTSDPSIQNIVLFYGEYLLWVGSIQPKPWSQVTQFDVQRLLVECWNVLWYTGDWLDLTPLRIQGLLKELSNKWVIFLSQQDIVDVVEAYKLCEEKFKWLERQTISFNWSKVLYLEHLKMVFLFTLFSLTNGHYSGKAIPDRDTLIIAFLHDIYEDTDMSLIDIKERFWVHVSIQVKLLSKVPKENYIYDEWSSDINSLVLDETDQLNASTIIEQEELKKQEPKLLRNLFYLEKMSFLADRRCVSSNPDDHYLYFWAEWIDDFLTSTADNPMDIIKNYWTKPESWTQWIDYYKVSIHQLLEIKLKDQLHNLTTSYDMPFEKIVRKLQEIYCYYLPIAIRIRSSTTADFVRILHDREQWLLAKKEFDEQLTQKNWLTNYRVSSEVVSIIYEQKWNDYKETLKAIWIDSKVRSQKLFKCYIDQFNDSKTNYVWYHSLLKLFAKK